MSWRCPSQNTFGLWTVLYWTWSLRTQFSMSRNVCRLVGDTLNITCNFLYCNHQVHRDFLITLYKHTLFHLEEHLDGIQCIYTIGWTKHERHHSTEGLPLPQPVHPFSTHFLLWRGSTPISATWTQDKQQVRSEFFQDFKKSLKFHDYNTYTYPKITVNWNWRKSKKEKKMISQ